MLSVGSSRKPQLELFPFISLFLCVIGVLAFLQNLLVIGELGASEEEAPAPQIFQTAYRIETLVDRLILYPPDNELVPVYQSLNLEETSAIKSIENRRNFFAAQNTDSTENSGQILKIDDPVFELRLQLELNEISTLNRLAKEHGLPYEEYILLNIHSGGRDTYHFMANLLDRPNFKHIRSGLDLAPDSNAVISSPQ